MLHTLEVLTSIRISHSKWNLRSWINAHDIFQSWNCTQFTCKKCSISIHNNRAPWWNPDLFGASRSNQSVQASHLTGISTKSTWEWYKQALPIPQYVTVLWLLLSTKNKVSRSKYLNKIELKQGTYRYVPFFRFLGQKIVNLQSQACCPDYLQTDPPEKMITKYYKLFLADHCVDNASLVGNAFNQSMVPGSRCHFFEVSDPHRVAAEAKLLNSKSEMSGLSCLLQLTDHHKPSMDENSHNYAEILPIPS